MKKKVLLGLLFMNICFWGIGKSGANFSDIARSGGNNFSAAEWGGEASPTPSPTPTPIPVTSPVGNE